MTCRVEIATGGGSQRPVLPIQAILTGDSMKLDSKEKESKESVKGAGVVFTVKDGVARKKQVKVGIADDNNQEVLSGVDEGEKVVVGPARILRSLRDGDMVKELKPADKDAAKDSKSTETKTDGKKP
jgi:HlyD family secretion protein